MNFVRFLNIFQRVPFVLTGSQGIKILVDFSVVDVLTFVWFILFSQRAIGMGDTPIDEVHYISKCVEFYHVVYPSGSTGYFSENATIIYSVVMPRKYY